MNWTDDPTLKQTLCDSEARQDWAEYGALQAFDQIRDCIPKEVQDLSRLGPVCVGPLEDDDEELYWWVKPLDRSKIKGTLIGAKSEVKIVHRTQGVVYSGPFGDADPKLVTEEVETLIWMAPISRCGPQKQWSVKKGLVGNLLSKLNR